MANLKKINLGGTTYDIVDNGGRLLIGTTSSLKTNVKTDLVVAINEVFDAVGTGGTNAVVTVEKSTDGLAYTLKQGGSEIGVINIPKDMVVNGGSYADGNLTLNIANGDPVVIPVADLIDLYTGGKNTEIAVDVDSNNVITATLEAKGVTTAKLADGAVTTDKIADKNVTEGKLEQNVQDALALARTAYQKPSTGIATNDLATGVVTSLGKADTAYQKPSTGIPATDLTAGLKDEISRLSAVTKGYTGDNAIGTAISEVNQAAAQKAGQAETNAKAYADGLASNYATAAQGAKADASIRKIEIDSETEDYISISDTATEGTKELLLAVMDVASTTAKGNLADAYDVKGYVDSAKSGLQNQINAIANGVDNNFSAVETRFGTNEANINKALTATKETFTYDAATETLTITSSAV